MEKMIAGKPIAVNEEGYLTDFKQWDKSVAEQLATEAQIELSPATGMFSRISGRVQKRNSAQHP